MMAMKGSVEVNRVPSTLLPIIPALTSHDNKCLGVGGNATQHSVI